MRRALGKGLSQLLGESAEATPRSLPVEAIQPNARQPRRSFEQDALAELAASIKEFGVLQPLVVRPIGGERYELIAGERRLRASKLAGLTEVPVVVRSADAQASLEIALIENVQREDITALECALAYRRLIDEFGLTQEQVAERVGKSRVAISNTLRLLRLPEPMQYAIQSGSVSEGHARALLMTDSPVAQQKLFKKILEDGISVREAEKMARKEPAARIKVGQEQSKPKPEPPSDPNWRALEEALSNYFGAIVRLQKRELGGSVVIDFYSDEDLDRILEVLGVRL